MKQSCSRCGKLNLREGQRYCHDCHRETQVRYRNRLKKKVELAMRYAPKEELERVK